MVHRGSFYGEQRMLRRIIEKEIMSLAPSRIGSEEVVEIGRESIENLIWCLERFYEGACEQWTEVLADVASSLPVVRLEKAVRGRVDRESFDVAVLDSIVEAYSRLYSAIVGGVVDGDTVLAEVKRPIASPEGVIVWPGAVVALKVREAVGLSVGGFVEVVAPAALTSSAPSRRE